MSPPTGSTMAAAGRPSGWASSRAARSASRMRSAASTSGVARLPYTPTPSPSSTPRIEMTTSSSSSVTPPGPRLVARALDLVVGKVIVRPEHAVGPGRAELEAVELPRRAGLGVGGGVHRHVLRAGIALHPVGEAVAVVARDDVADRIVPRIGQLQQRGAAIYALEGLAVVLVPVGQPALLRALAAVAGRAPGGPGRLDALVHPVALPHPHP